MVLEIEKIVLVVCGLLTHVLLDLVKLKRDGKPVSFWQYLKDQPYQTALSVIGCVAGYIVLNSIGELTLMTAYGLGTMSNLVAEKLGQKDINKVL